MQPEGIKKNSLFREKSLEAIESPESLNDYLRVTSPKVWLVLAAVIAVLIGGIFWGILGRIDVRKQVAVVTADGKTTCYVPFEGFDSLRQIVAQKEVTVNGTTYALNIPESGDVEAGFVSEFIGEQMISRACIIGGMKTNDTVVALPVDAPFGEDGVKSGTVTVETLRPISLLLQ
ncbi:MAG: hypothetical protein IKP10_03150 [Clostridia bacterium]|nr:hypothetical protein [Clostridia bacterium]